MKRLPGILLILTLSLATSAGWSQSASTEVPAFHEAAPPKAEKLPAMLTPDKLSPENRQPLQMHAYEIAGKIPEVLYQQPCYCFCSKSVGHKSLRSCFESEHGAHCSTCMQEAYYAYKMTKAGWSAKQIRQGIVSGSYKTITQSEALAMK